MMVFLDRVFRSMTSTFRRRLLPRTRARAWIFFRLGDQARDSRNARTPPSVDSLPSSNRATTAFLAARGYRAYRFEPPTSLVTITVPVDGDFWFIPADDPADSTSSCDLAAFPLGSCGASD